MFKSEISRKEAGSSPEIVAAEKKRKYFFQLLRGFPQVLKLYKEFGILRSDLEPQGAFKNVAKHMATEAGVADALAERLQLPAEDRRDLVEAILLHDVYKREFIENVRPYDSARDTEERFFDSNSRQGTETLRRLGVNPRVIKIISSIDTAGLVSMQKTQPEYIEKLAWYIDSITANESLVEIEERVKIFKKHSPHINEFGKQQFGMPSYDFYVQYGREIEKELAEMLGLPQDSPMPQALTALLKQKIDAVELSR